MTRFRVLEMSVDLIRNLRGLNEVIGPRSRDLRNQIERAGSSVALNVAEANRKTGNDRLNRFRIAAGSADEVRAALRVAEAWGYVEAADIEESLELIDGLLGMLWALSREKRKNRKAV